jgi:hypothetical protein
VGEVHARDGGRGIFSVSGSGGLTVDRVDIANTGNTAILLEDCYDTTIATESGTVAGPGTVRAEDAGLLAGSRDTMAGWPSPSRSLYAVSECGGTRNVIELLAGYIRALQLAESE